MALSNLQTQNTTQAPSSIGAVISFSNSVDGNSTSSLGSVDTTQDIQALRQQATRLEHLLQVMPAGVVVIDGKGYVKQANHLAKSLLGEPLEGQVWRNIIKRSFKPQADDGHEVSLFDGRKVKLSITPLVNEPGQLIVLTDLTETRQLQQRIGHLQKLSSLGKMVASLAHQIRTPLSAAMLYAANLSSGDLAKESRQRFSDKLLSRLRDLEGQVNDMLLFAKSGNEQVLVDISLEDMMREVKAGSEAMLNKSGGILDIILPEPNIHFIGNKTALSGALQNLIHNALIAKPNGARIVFSAQRDDLKPDCMRLTVTDNGPGIPKDKLDHIFEPFFTTRSQGTGLGLAVVKTVVQSHQGEVSVSNLASGGACFTIVLPILTRTADEGLSAGATNIHAQQARS
ncbi:two-component system, sensor histidine kinase FlrB [Paraglaciecola mesophila KMM 241]|uniref:histidine kinase n=1 Tax=Paraglaciecola mesophila KMM 241 TaxID=1128912 RepID=K6Z3E4_9ALTE|nr:ATP-binding protein [Paraglaciecola mesophila]GAC24882.1 two-component system, sensor histidine kinase FlrB [Paraglaciecola mesophila KMM 241]